MKNREVQKFFEEYIFKYVFEDIGNCIEARANYVVATALLAYTEYLGGLISGDLGLEDKSSKNFNEALNYFDWNGDKNYYKNFKVTLDGKEVNIYKVFRCGLIHEYFAKGQCLIHNNSDHRDHWVSEDAGIGWIENDSVLRFHTNAYFRDFKKATLKFYNELMSASIKLDNFSASLSRISSRKIIK